MVTFPKAGGIELWNNAKSLNAASWSAYQATFDASNIMTDTTANDNHWNAVGFTTTTDHIYRMHLVVKKLGTPNYVYGWVYLSTKNPACFWNLATGAVSATANCDSVGIQSLGDSYYDCWFQFTESGGGLCYPLYGSAAVDGATTYIGLAEPVLQFRRADFVRVG